MPSNVLYLMQEFMKFKNTFRGNPQEQVQQLLQSGNITRAQYEQAVAQAQQLQAIINGNIQN